jgi:hypothetical protein
VRTKRKLQIGMTKERVVLRKGLLPAPTTTLSFSNRPFLKTTLSFVIPSVAEGSAVFS